MIINMYSIHDKLANTYSIPEYAINTVQAQRQFIVMGQESKSAIAKFPKEHELVCVGQFDNEKGSFIPMDKPVVLMQGEEAIKYGQD